MPVLEKGNEQHAGNKAPDMGAEGNPALMRVGLSSCNGIMGGLYREIRILIEPVR